MRLAVIIIILFLVSCNQSNSRLKQNRKVDQPKIKTCRMYSSDFEVLDKKSLGQLIQEFRFNKEGFVRELIRYDNQGEIVNRFDILDETSPFPTTEKPKYMDTVIVETEIGILGDTRKKEVKHYNNRGYLIEVQIYNSSDSLKQKNTYNYNKEGYISKDIYWDVDLGVPMQVINYEYEYFTY